MTVVARAIAAEDRLNRSDQPLCAAPNLQSIVCEKCRPLNQTEADVDRDGHESLCGFWNVRSPAAKSLIEKSGAAIALMDENEQAKMGRGKLG